MVATQTPNFDHKIATSHYLTMSDQEKEGTPLDRRIIQPEGLDWDLIRHNYMENGDASEKRFQATSLEHTSGRYAKDGKVRTDQEINEERAVLRVSLPTQERVVDYYKVGNKVAWIANETNISPVTVRKILRDAGVYEPKRDMSRKGSSDE